MSPENVTVTVRPIPVDVPSVHDNPLFNRLLLARGVRQTDELSFSLSNLPRPDTLPDIDKAVERLLRARQNRERLVVIGDYDCDGATSTAVAIQGLSMLGFDNIDYLIPSRFTYGYGLSPAIVELALRERQAEVLLTVDNGVASVEGVAYARDKQLDVVVTDHHIAPSELPSACAIVNPTLPQSRFPSSHLAGVGVIFYTLLALRARLQELADPSAKTSLADLLDLVAIGTVADVVPLDTVNRILVEQGLRRIRAGRTRAGVRALLKEAGRTPEQITTEDIGFAIGPRLNAAGRLDDMHKGVECLLSDSPEVATAIAGELDSLNRLRRRIERDMSDEAHVQLADTLSGSLPLEGQFGVCLFDDSWHQGVIGILAGRIKESLHRPVIVFTTDGATLLKGSARSIPAVHIRDELQAIAAASPELIENFGGHAMAAGLTVHRDRYDQFKAAFNEHIKKTLQGRHSERHFLTDGGLSIDERTLENASALIALMPWGQGFEPPVFVDEFRLIEQRPVGNGHLKLRLEDAERRSVYEAIAFNQEPVVPSEGLQRIVYALSVNRWRDRESLQLRVLHLDTV